MAIHNKILMITQKKKQWQEKMSLSINLNFIAIIIIHILLFFIFWTNICTHTMQLDIICYKMIRDNRIFFLMET